MAKAIAKKQQPRLRRYRVSWIGLFDGQRKDWRVLTLRAQNKQQASKLIEDRYPSRRQRVEAIKGAR